MTAVYEAGNSVARYRTIHSTMSGLGMCDVEVAIDPGWKLTDKPTLAIVVSAPRLSSYFPVQRSGG
jgi:hypothetical protein